MHRWTSQWLADDTTWVIGFGKPVPWSQDYSYTLSVRTAHILNEHFYKDEPKVRFGVVDYTEWEDIKETLYMPAYGVIVLKDGLMYYNAPL